MAFWDNVKSWWGDITGDTQKKAGQAAQNTANTTMGTAAGTLGGIAAQSPEQAAAAAQKSAQAAGEQQGRTAATEGSQQALQAARTSGLNAGQAALVGGQQAGKLFTQGQTAGVGQGLQNYQNAAGNQINAAAAQGGVGANQAAAGTNQAGQGQQEGKDFWGGVTGLATSALGLSDRNAKTDIKDDTSTDKAAQTIGSKTFRYKDGPGATEHGVIAQDVEKVAPGNVVETSAGKAIDTRKQTLSNTGWIMDAVRRIQALERKA